LQRQRLKNQYRRGFTLLELAIVMAIIGVIVASGISLGLSRTEAARISSTEAKLDRIEEALGAYLVMNGFLPCPAVGSTAKTVATFGVAEAAGCASTTCTGGGCGTDLKVGVVPVRTLNLSDDYMFDGWGRRITYAVHRKATLSRADFADTSAGIITIQNYAQTSNLSTDALLILMSHGNNGHGAWPESGQFSGTQNRVTAGVTAGPETENAETVATELSFDATFVQARRATNFDDIVRYFQKWQIVKAAGGVISAAECEIARRTLCPKNVATAKGPVGCDTVDASLQQQCEDRQTRLARTVHALCFNPEPIGAGECGQD
jgi:prepilin-type N-terminal cleavage/methylation domain-containing protein